LQTYLDKQQTGDMITPECKIVGKHTGLAYYTLGQRKGLGIGGGHGNEDDAWFVADKDMTNNRLIVVQGHNHPAMLKSRLTAHTMDWCDTPPQTGDKLTAKVRYRQQSQACTVTATDDNRLSLTFDFPQRAVTPGQSVVLYDGDVCLGGAIITEAFA
jgi:tRNA-specific 2-thiouridylase